MERKKQKTCRHCRTKYTPGFNAMPFENWCSVDCAIGIARKAQERARDKRRKRELMAQNDRKAELETPQQRISKATQKAEAAVRAYVRARDIGRDCISCGKSPLEVESGPYRAGGYWDAGHYISKGSHPELRLLTTNIHRQCKTCNGGTNFLRYSGTGKAESVREGYRLGLIEKIGLEKVLWLEGPHPPLKASLEYLERVRRIFKKRERHISRILRNL